MNKPILINNSRIMSELKSSLYVEYNKERTGVHISDLIYCPRESLFRKLTPIALTDKELNFFTSGRAVHDAIETLAKVHPKYELEKEIEFYPAQNEYTKDILGVTEDLKLLAHIDLFDTVNNIPIEAKTARKARLGIYNKSTRKWSEEQPKSFNVTQLKIYMALTDSDKGYLMYQLLMNFEDNPFKIFEISVSKGERIEILRAITKEAIQINEGLRNKDASIVRHIANDKELNWKCNGCKFLNPCLEMRMKEK